jgi:hypothetical protein
MCIEMVITPPVIDIFFMKPAPLDSGCTLEHSVIIKKKFYEKLQMVYFVIAGHIYSIVSMYGKGCQP